MRQINEFELKVNYQLLISNFYLSFIKAIMKTFDTKSEIFYNILLANVC